MCVSASRSARADVRSDFAPVEHESKSFLTLIDFFSLRFESRSRDFGWALLHAVSCSVSSFTARFCGSSAWQCCSWVFRRRLGVWWVRCCQSSPNSWACLAEGTVQVCSVLWLTRLWRFFGAFQTSPWALGFTEQPRTTSRILGIAKSNRDVVTYTWEERFQHYSLSSRRTLKNAHFWLSPNEPLDVSKRSGEARASRPSEEYGTNRCSQPRSMNPSGWSSSLALGLCVSRFFRVRKPPVREFFGLSGSFDQRQRIFWSNVRCCQWVVLVTFGDSVSQWTELRWPVGLFLVLNHWFAQVPCWDKITVVALALRKRGADSLGQCKEPTKAGTSASVNTCRFPNAE